MSLTLVLEMAVASHGDRVALGSRQNGMTFQDLATRLGAVAAVIADRSPRHVVFIGKNGPAFPQVLLGAAAAGVPFCPVNYRLSRETILDLVSELAPCLVFADAAYIELVRGEHECLATDDLDTIPDANGGAVGQADDDAPAILLFTSGTTARPKAVVLRHRHLLAYIFSTVELGAASPDEAALVAVPPYHVAAVGSALSNLYSGRRVIYLGDFDAQEWLRLAREECVTSAMVVPTMLARIVDSLNGAPADVPTLRLLSYGGARMPLPVLEKALHAFPDVDFCNAYGLTETSSTLALLDPADHRVAFQSADPKVRRRLSSIGRPVPGVEAEIRDSEGRPVPTGTVGELWVRGAQVSGEYLGRQCALDRDGWFHTRDLAWADDDGYLFVEGRADDTIIRGGENIAPAEVEEVLSMHPAVKDAAVVGVPDEEWGERLVAVVVREPGRTATAEELRNHVRQRLRGSRTPDDVVWRDELPYTPTGKLLRRMIVAELTEDDHAGRDRD